MDHENKRSNQICLILLGVSFAVWQVILWYKQFYFGYYDWDFAIHTQAMYLLGRGISYIPLFGIPYFGDHANYISLLVVPLFKLFPYPLTLLTLKNIIFHLGAASLFYITREYLGKFCAFAMLFIYLIYPPNIFAQLYEFNFDVFAILLLMWMVYFFKTDRFKGFVIISLLVLSIKENFSLILVMFGIVSLFLKRKEKVRWVVFSVVTGAVTFIVLNEYLIPHFRGLEAHAFVARYSYMGSSIGEILFYMIRHPVHVLEIITSAYNLKFLEDLFGCLFLPGILGLEVLVLPLPIFVQHLLSNFPTEQSIYFHYSYSLTPFILLSVVYGLARIKKYINVRTVKIGLAIISAVVFFQSVSFIYTYKARNPLMEPGRVGIAYKIISFIPPDAGVISTFSFLSHLSLREQLYSFQKVYHKKYQSGMPERNNTLFTGKAFTLPDEVSYALIDFLDPFLFYNLSHRTEYTVPKVRAFFDQYRWGVVAEGKGIFLFERIPPDQAQLYKKRMLTVIINNYPIEITIYEKNT